MIDPSILFPKPMARPITIREAWEGIPSVDDCKQFHSGQVAKIIAEMRSGEDGSKASERLTGNPNKWFNLRRLSWRLPGFTITKSPGSSILIHPEENRAINTAEMMRIASFPDSFQVVGNYQVIKERIGNSVPPKFMEAIARRIKEVLFPNMEPTVISTFAGCGGSSLGYKFAGFRELLAVEWDDNAVETFKLNFPGVPVYHGDIAKLTVEECLKLAGVAPGELDILDGSPPCQGFSTAGKRQMNDSRNQLFREYVRLLRGLKPKVFVMENVSGMVKGKMKLIFAEIMRELKESGYWVKCQLMNAMYFNVPQSRERVIFIGVREDLDIEPTFPKAQSRLIGPKREVGAIEKYLTPKETTQARAHKARHLAKGNGWGWQELTETKPSPTWPKTQILETSPLWVEGEKLRAPSTIELKRIGSYPESFKFLNYDDEWLRIGNSVPPRFMQAIAEHIRDHVLGV